MGSTAVVEMHDGSHIVLKKLDNAYDPTDKYAAMRLLEEAHQKQEFITGLIYINERRPGLPELERLPATPLAQLPAARLRPSKDVLDGLMRKMM